MNDRNLLSLFVQRGDEAAFSALARRYIMLVYSTCLRETRSVALAEDATQAVFLLLARKAPALLGRPVLSGWLFHTARLAGKNVLRDERIHKEYERRALEEQMRSDRTNSPDWSDIDAGLHEALSRLRSKDRDALLLRFFEEISYAELGDRLGVTEDAARSRVHRALEQLRRKLSPAGNALTAVALAALLSANAGQSVSAACLNSVERLPSQIASGASFIGSQSLSHQIAQGLSKTMLIHQLRVAGVIAAAAACGAGAAHLYAHPSMFASQVKPKSIHQAGVAPKVLAFAADPFAQFQLSGGFTLHWTSTIRDVQTTKQRASMVEEARRQYQSSVQSGDVNQSDADKAIAGLEASIKTASAPQSYEVTLSSSGDSLFAIGRAPGASSRHIVAYDGAKTSICDDRSDHGPHILRVSNGLLLNDERMNAIVLPGVGFPQIALARRRSPGGAVSASEKALHCEVADLGMGFGAPVHYRPGIVWYRMVDGAPQVTKILVGTLSSPSGVWNFDHFQRLNSRWIAGRSRLTRFNRFFFGKPTKPYPMDQTDYVITDAEPAPLPASQTDIRTHLTPNDLIAEDDGGHQYTAFPYDPQGGDIEAQFQKRLVDHTVH